MKLETAREILTPEHVPIQLLPAGLGTRCLALLVDFAIILAVSVVINIIMAFLSLMAIPVAMGTAITFVVQWGYHLYFEVRRQGQSLGKKMMGLRVVDGRGLPITFQQSFVRNIVRALDWMPFFYGVGGMTALLNSKNKRLGDILADTLVIHERSGLDYTKHFAKDRRVNSLRTPRVLRRLRHQVSLEEREFLLSLCLRSGSMDPQARFDVMEEVGNHYRDALEIDDPHMSGENIVRGLTAVLYGNRD